jgi:polysaccharide export outer membrane protein
VFALLALTSACASSGTLGTLSFAAADASTATLRPGDRVNITVWRQPDYSGEFAIASDSSISHPLYQDVKVAGVPVAVAEQRIRTFLSRYETNPQVVVEPLFSIAVGGEVRTPNLYSLPPQTTLSQAIAKAGGPTETGRLDKVKLVRGGREVTVNLAAANAEWANVPVRSGDVIVVGKKHDILREYIGPFASMVAAAASVVYAIRR